MDPYRFDEWTKAFGSGRSRRAFLAGVLRAGAAAIGFAAASAQAARADDNDDDDDDDDDDGPSPTCEQRLDRCQNQSNFNKCAKCLEEYKETGCPIFRTPDLNFEQLVCSCTSDRYCADGNGCTLDICSSNVCYNDPVESFCVQCRSNRQCPNGGKCCKGRCCRAGTFCRTNEQGHGICCEKCTNDETCCQNIDTAGDPNDSRQYVVAIATCVGQEGANFEPPLPTFCCGGCGGGYDADGGPGCSCPQRSLP